MNKMHSEAVWKQSLYKRRPYVICGARLRTDILDNRSLAMLLEISKGLIYQTLVSGQPLSREGSFNVPSAHQPGRKDAPWKLKVNGVTTPLAPTAARLTRTTSKCTATLKDAFAAPPVN